MNEEQVKEVLKLMQERFVGNKKEHEVVAAVVEALCKTIKVTPAVQEKAE